MSDRKTLILFSHVCNRRNITGAEKLLFFLARKLSQHFQCTIVAPNEGRLTDLARSSGFNVIIMDIPLLYDMYMPNENLTANGEQMAGNPAMARVLDLLRQESPNYIFVNTCVHLIPAMAGKCLGIPVIWHITEIIRDNEYAHQSVALIHKYSDWILGISEAALAPLRIGQLEENMSLLYPSWDNAELDPASWGLLRERKRWEWGMTPQHKVIGYISSFLIHEKGPDHFIQAATRIGKQYPDTQFVIIGGEVDRSYYRYLKKTVKEAKLSKRFKFIEYEMDIEAAYCAMDIVVIPSLQSEGFGMTAMEAMVFGKPVIAYASGGLREILDSTGAGAYLIPTGDNERLTASLSQLLQNPELMEHVGRNNQSQIELRFGSAAYEGRLWGFVQRILEMRGTAVPLPMIETPAPVFPLNQGVVSVDASTLKRKRKKTGRSRLKRSLRRHLGKKKKTRTIHARKKKKSYRKSPIHSRKVGSSRKRVRRRRLRKV